MKVKEILEILNVPQADLLTKLENVGINASLETDIAPDIIKKLSKSYKVDIKPVKQPKKKLEEESLPKVENPVSEVPSKPITPAKEQPKEEPRKVEQTAPVKKPESKGGFNNESRPQQSANRQEQSDNRGGYRDRNQSGQAPRPAQDRFGKPAQPGQQSREYRPNQPGQQSREYKPSQPGQQSREYRPNQPGQQSREYRPSQPGQQSRDYKPAQSGRPDNRGSGARPTNTGYAKKPDNAFSVVDQLAKDKKIKDKHKDSPVKSFEKESAFKPEHKPVKKLRDIRYDDEDLDSVELNRTYDDKYNDYETEAKVYTRIKNIKKKQSVKGSRQTNITGNEKAKEDVLVYTPGITVAQIADGLNVPVGEVVKKLVMLGYFVSASQVLDKEVIEIIADDYQYTVKDKVEEDITRFEDIAIVDDPKNLVSRPAIVTIMGHVDHGKTTLLDTLRNSHVTASEAGGITQHIGAYQVAKNGKYITFIDTPGHAAFTEMRARGANVTDIVILVVAADDGVMPQTREAIDHAKAANVPIIVAVNKIDKPTANIDRVKQELSQLDLVPEEWGGKTIYVPISALTGKGVDDLLEMLVLTADLEDFKANPNRLGFGTVIEAKLDKGKGPVATLLVKNGTIKVGDPIVVGNTYGKIRAMQDETKAHFKSAGPSKAVEITGLESVPLAGDFFMVFEDEKTARLISEERAMRAFDKEMNVGQPVSLANLFNQTDNKELNLVVKGDVQGSIEAIRGSLDKITVEGVKINIVRSGVGSITETDISLALASRSIVIAFNIRPNAKVLEYAREKSVEVRMYNIIYKVLEDIEAAMQGMLDPVYEEKILGQAEVRSIFKASKIGTIAGSYVTDGLISRNAEVRLIRDSIVVYQGKLSSLKRFKDDAKEVKAGFECGITIENYNDIKEGDIIEAYTMEKVK